MNPTTIPNSEVWPGAVRFVAMPPDGDMTGEGGIEPAEMLKGTLDGTDVPFHAMRFTATPEEAQRLMNGEPIWLVYFFPFPVPVALQFADVLIAPVDEARNIPVRIMGPAGATNVLMTRTEYDAYLKERGGTPGNNSDSAT